MDSEWIEIPTDDGEVWSFDRRFLESNWTCIWDRGCGGIAETSDVEAQLGCCSVGAEMLDDDEAMRIAALGASLDPATTQFATDIEAGGSLRRIDSDRATWATRVVDGACIFLNRPGFAGGSGCALHIGSATAEDSHIDWKPSICWQLPIKVERTEEQNTLRGWLRTDWGSEGESMAYCCTERDSTIADAFVGDAPVIDSLRGELEALLGESLFVRLKDALG